MLRNVGGFDWEGYQCVECADGKLWEEEGSGECSNCVKFLRMVFDRLSGAIESVGGSNRHPVARGG
jgi:hypothetical protein